MRYVLGLSGGYRHDSAACLVRGGEIVAFAEEERFTRQKHNQHFLSCGRATAYCLAKAGIRLEDVASIALGWNPVWPDDAEYIEDTALIQELLEPRFFDGFTPKRLKVIDHHLAHAASAFYCSGFAEATVLVVDGSGDGVATSVGYGQGDGIKFTKTYDVTQSLGFFYEAVTEHVGLGDWTNAGKLMGLAAYGQPEYPLDFVRPTPEGFEIDRVALGLDATTASLQEYVEMTNYRRLKKAFAQMLEQSGCPSQMRMVRLNDEHTRFINATDFSADHKNLAASAQDKLEACVLALAADAVANTGNGKICIAGGIGLNCSANGKLFASPFVEDLYIQPAAGDAGCSIGAALETCRQLGELSIPRPRMVTTSFGPAFSNEVIHEALNATGLHFTFHPTDIAHVTAHALAHGAAVGWFQGQMEGGPRALGNRSILIDPRQEANRDRINLDIKRRESWRPLAPSILDSRISDYAVDAGPADFMIVAYQASERAREQLPATVHVDGSMRPQRVRRETNPKYSALLEAFEAITGVPALLNTSFNHEAEPIVCTPVDAIRTFCSTPLDVLAIGDFLVTKERASGGVSKS